MDKSLILIGIIAATWLLLTCRLHKVRLHFFKFFIGSVGLFFLLAAVEKAFFSQRLSFGTLYPLYLIGKATKICWVDLPSATVFFHGSSFSIFFTSEYSCFIEVLVYISVLCFYPLYGIWKKAYLLFWGVLSILSINVLRMVVLCMFVRSFGTQAYALANVVLSRSILIVFLIIIYYFSFTLPHITKQKVGKTHELPH